MTHPSRISIAILIAMVGFAWFLVMGYSTGFPEGRVVGAVRLVLTALAVFVLVAAIVRRDVSGIVIGAGLALWSADTFYPHVILSLGGTVLFIAGFIVASRQYRSANSGGARE